ncbi:Uncharacterised protein [Klebsiella michiganensis]|nr:Uncharacterised protein [Klebsiella michiganensis]
MEGYGFEITHPLNIFGNDRAINGAAEVLPGYSAERFAFHCLVPFVTVETRGYRILRCWLTMLNGSFVIPGLSKRGPVNILRS